jgi:AcrR family transcriptional regulator
MPERILQAASGLFAARGYYGTSTRDIASMVGIRQPSLFHHFDSKAALANALLEHSLGVVVPAVQALAEQPTPASARLYGYVHFDTRFLATSPYNLAGLYSDELLKSDGFEKWGESRTALHTAIKQIIQQGIGSEEFIVIDPEFARQVISSFNLITIGEHYAESESWARQFAEDVASFAMRAILLVASSLPSIRREGIEVSDRLMEAVTAASPLATTAITADGKHR